MAKPCVLTLLPGPRRKDPFPVKDQIGNILVFAGHMQPLNSAIVVKTLNSAAIDSIWKSEHGHVPV